MARLLFAALALAAFGAAPAAAQSRTENGAFVARLGNDTIFAERYTRTASRLEGEQVVRSPRTALRRYAVDFGPGGWATRAELSVHRPNAEAGAAPLQRVVATFSHDTATVEVWRGDSSRTQRVPVPAGAAPLFGQALGPYEALVMRAWAARAESVVVAGYSVGAAGAEPFVLRRVGRDSMHITYSLGTYHARVDDAGRVLWLDGLGTTFQVAVERVAALDLAALARSFAARDAGGQGLGPLSPRDTVRASVAGANLLVDYGRPAKRGRIVFPNVVPWNQVWRTGANAATHFRTDRDLVLGGVNLPAGTYTLFSLPTEGGWTLIVNRQTGQWGTDYNAAHDLARIEMRVTSVAQPVERFTIGITPASGGGVLTLAWDTRQASLPFTVR